MANSFVQYTGDGSTTAFSITFDFIDAAHLACTVNGVGTSYTLSSGNTVATLGSAPANGAAIQFTRTSSQGTRLTDYVAGSVLKESDLDTDSKQGFFMGQEAIDTAANTIQQDISDFNWTAGNKKIKNVTNPTLAQDAATKNYVDTGVTSQVVQATSQATAAGTSASNASTSQTAAANSATAAAASATAAAASETAAGSSETTSGTNATNSSNSATAAASSQSAAATSATNAANSESAVSTNATNAANSATAAASSASAASTSKSNASTSETNSSASQTAAANSATASANSASAASTSETNAASSATAAATSATNAGTSATNAATSASTATTQATNAATSATAAQAAQTAAELAADNFDDTYLGAKSSNPSVDNDGSALNAGDLYFNTTDNKLKVYDGSNWNDTVISTTNLVQLNVDGDATFTGAQYNVVWDKSANSLKFPDNAKAVFGAVPDLSIYHDGSNSVIAETGTGGLAILSSVVQIENAAANETMATFTQNGAVSLRHDNTEKFVTTADGVDITSTGSVKVPVGTTAQRNGAPATGDFRFNSTVATFEGYNGSAWGSVGGGATGAGGDTVFQENERVVTTNYTLSSNKSAMCVGPLTINTGVTVTIPSGERLVIL